MGSDLSSELKEVKDPAQGCLGSEKQSEWQMQIPKVRMYLLSSRQREKVREAGAQRAEPRG